jgi:hypothetical protein
VVAEALRQDALVAGRLAPDSEGVVELPASEKGKTGLDHADDGDVDLGAVGEAGSLPAPRLVDELVASGHRISLPPP